MGRPQETESLETGEKSPMSDANGNGAQHHSPLKSNTGPSERSQEQEPRKSGIVPAAAMSSTSTDEASHANGVNLPSTDEGGAGTSKSLTPEECLKKQQADAAEDVRKRMWLLRLPRPITQSEKKSFDEQRGYARNKLKDLVSKLATAKDEREKMRKARDDARETAKAFAQLVIVKDKELAPYTQEMQRRKQTAADAKALYAGVQFRSEEELDAAIAPLEYRVAHETVSNHEEQALVKQISKLQKMRATVRKDAEARAKTAAELALRAEVEAASAMSWEKMKARSEALNAEKDRLIADRKSQSALCEEFSAEAERLDQVVSELVDAKNKAKDELAELDAELGSKQRSMGDLFKKNRSFSSEVRQIIHEGDVQRARQMCTEQANEWNEKLSEDAEFRQEYVRLWKLQHEEDKKTKADEARARAEAQKARAEENGNAAKAAMASAKPKKEVSEEIIAGLLDSGRVDKIKTANAKAKELEVARVKAAGEPVKGAKKGAAKGAPTKDAADEDTAAVPDTAEAPALANGHTSEPEREAEAHDPAEPRKTLGALQMEEMAGSNGVPAKAKVLKRMKPEKKAFVEIPAIIGDETPFVPPVVFLKRDVEEIDEEEERERARLRNAEAAREAEARKERRRKKAEQKARVLATRDAHRNTSTKEDDKAPKEPTAPATEEPPAAVAAEEVPQASAPAPAAAAAAAKPSGGGGKPGGRVGKHIGAPVAKSRVQVNRRKGTLQRTLACLQQQLPKSLMHRVLVAVLALLAVWLLIEVLVPRRLSA